MNIGITGGTGFVGGHLADLLIAEGHRVTVFTRHPKESKGAKRYAAWDPEKLQVDSAALEPLDAVVNLAGASVVEKRWTAGRKAEILNSRVGATNFLHTQLAKHAPRCKVFVSASATGYYGPDRQARIPFKEEDPAYTDFLADVCKQWEAAAFSAQQQYERTVVLRIGIVLGRDGGAFPELSGPMKWGIMPILGSGEQVVSWIHVDDLARLFQTAITASNFNGVYNAVAPKPVTHQALMQTIAKVKGGVRIPAPVPAFALRLLMGESSIEILKSCTVSCAKTESAGFRFQHSQIEGAIKSILGRS